MTVHAGGQDMRFLFPEFAADRLAVHFFDLGVALGAGGRDVAAVDRGIRVRVGQDVVGGVAGNAICRNDQSLLEQRLAVNALGIVLNDVVLINLPLGLDRGALAVALSADERYFQRSHGGKPILDRQDIVIAVAVHAMRSQGIASGDGFAVQGVLVLLLLVAVAGATLDARQRGGVR